MYKINSLFNSENEAMFDDEAKMESADDTIDDHEFNLAIKEDGNYNNQINNMITDIYKAANPNPTSNATNSTDPNGIEKKSNLKSVSMFDSTPPITQEEFNNRKRVKFVNEQEMIKKRKLPGEAASSSESKSKQMKSKDKLDLIKYSIKFQFII